MRYYELNLYEPGTSTPSRTWTTHPNGAWDPGALLIEFDIIALPFAMPAGGSSLTLHGIALQDLMQAQQFGMRVDASGKILPGMTLELRGGMQRGLPLANPAQIGTLVCGMVYQSFGTWRGTDMHVDFTILAQTYTQDNPGNIVLNWKRGQKLSDALRECLLVAYPDKTIKVDISDQIVADQDMPHMASTLEGLSRAIADTGVDIAIHGNTVMAFDGSAKGAVIQLSLEDLIGQPTWVDINKLQVDVVLRGDISVNDHILMPPGLINSPGMVAMTANAFPGMNNYQATFQGEFKVTGERHIGNSRAPDASLWGTHLVCIPTPASGPSSNG